MPMHDGRKKNVDVPDSKRNNVNDMRFTSFTFMNERMNKQTNKETNEETNGQTNIQAVNAQCTIHNDAPRDALAFAANIR